MISHGIYKFAPEFYQMCAFFANIKTFIITLESQHLVTFSVKYLYVIFEQ